MYVIRGPHNRERAGSCAHERGKRQNVLLVHFHALLLVGVRCAMALTTEIVAAKTVL